LDSRRSKSLWNRFTAASWCKSSRDVEQNRRRRRFVGTVAVAVLALPRLAVPGAQNRQPVPGLRPRRLALYDGRNIRSLVPPVPFGCFRRHAFALPEPACARCASGRSTVSSSAASRCATATRLLLRRRGTAAHDDHEATTQPPRLPALLEERTLPGIAGKVGATCLPARRRPSLLTALSTVRPAGYTSTLTRSRGTGLHPKPP
jgi:hypothetical protein